ncbi:2-oxo acid dehydrogenase subunit E2 [Halobacterium noricense]|uniref:2-oxo acid dehydrogenase subunit E2 n=1 Tax=Halobacterium noricense TaxID=223182 RepID=UPI001E50DBFB|nr:2-oxo acid dehydrogenase subunit E2 [Halobacterium noricense]UHH24049.1 2-oxo acid dehydrogenase subunit E2 [Halobacterium noricense]
MAEQTFELPDLGEGIAEGELVSWLVEPGDVVEADQTIAEVETDKALVEVPSPYDGTVKELHAAEGETVPVDSVIVAFEVEDDEGEAAEEVQSAVEPVEEGEASETGESGGRVFAAPSTRTLARELDADLADVSGSGPGGRITAADVRAHVESSGEAAEPAQTADATESESTEAEEPVLVESDGAARDRTLAMPATRQLAREKGVDINDVPTSEERDGEAFVTQSDVRAYVESGGKAAEPAEAETAGVGPTSGERVPYSGVRRTIGEQMARSKYTAPHVAHHDEFDATDLVAVREDLRDPAEAEGVNLTYLPFVVKAVTRALQEFPFLNSSLDEDAEEIVLHDEYNIGIAVATDAGLMVPVVEHADEKSLVELAAEIDDLATRARNRELSREEMQGGTFTITNIGVIGGEFSAPIINHPEAAILAMGPIAKRPWVVDDEVVARETMRLSMSVDHRLVDGAEAAQFTNRVQELLGQPARLLL